MPQKELDKNLFNKVVMYVLTGITTVLSYVAYIQRERVIDAQFREMQQQTVIDTRDRVIVILNKEKDSLQGLLLSRTDNSYEELKKILDIKNNNSTITIKPKSKIIKKR